MRVPSAHAGAILFLFHAASFHTVSFHTVSFRTISFRAVSFRAVSFRAISFRAVSFRAVSFRAISFRAVSFRAVSCHAVSIHHHFTSYRTTNIHPRPHPRPPRINTNRNHSISHYPQPDLAVGYRIPDPEIKETRPRAEREPGFENRKAMYRPKTVP
ncbi:pentapeptide repeat-containing protein [Acanthopleuribacter pedis]|uniref:Pentapeptide repeat-containing protein n=1 Tax=Acanthopleuribacter pedis TaxID=442870 RepID=A0A8J7QI00_9BACT|nr:pentapeptide repeat-containing protein [Acanthopleuribacter pedis]